MKTYITIRNCHSTQTECIPAKKWLTSFFAKGAKTRINKHRGKTWLYFNFVKLVKNTQFEHYFSSRCCIIFVSCVPNYCLKDKIYYFCHNLKYYSFKASMSNSKHCSGRTLSFKSQKSICLPQLKNLQHFFWSLTSHSYNTFVVNVKKTVPILHYHN